MFLRRISIPENNNWIGNLLSSWNLFFSDNYLNLEILDNAPIYWEAFMHNLLIWLLKSNLLSVIKIQEFLVHCYCPWDYY